MALTGVHVVCARVATRAGAILPIYPDWSETLAFGATTTNASVSESATFQVSASEDAYFSVGKEPVSNLAVGTGQSARYFIQGGTTREVFCNVGDKLSNTKA